MSSGYSCSPNTGIGNSAAAPSTSISVAQTSITPVGSSVFSVPAGRFRTLPSTRTTHSRAQRLGGLEGRAIRVGDALGDAVVVAQVDEQHAAMVADAVNPAGQAHGLADLALAKLAAGMGAIAVHDCPGGAESRRRAPALQ